MVQTSTTGMLIQPRAHVQEAGETCRKRQQINNAERQTIQPRKNAIERRDDTQCIHEGDLLLPC